MRALDTERVGRFQQRGAAFDQGADRLAQEGLGREDAGVRADSGQFAGLARRQKLDRPDAEFFEQPRKLVLDDVGQGADDQQRAFACRSGRQFRHH